MQNWSTHCLVPSSINSVTHPWPQFKGLRLSIRNQQSDSFLCTGRDAWHDITQLPSHEVILPAYHNSTHCPSVHKYQPFSKNFSGTFYMHVHTLDQMSYSSIHKTLRTYLPPHSSRSPDYMTHHLVACLPATWLLKVSWTAHCIHPQKESLKNQIPTAQKNLSPMQGLHILSLKWQWERFNMRTGQPRHMHFSSTDDNIYIWHMTCWIKTTDYKNNLLLLAKEIWTTDRVLGAEEN